ncbi:hypothetical protein M430DRAFT_200888 [Amorphotheca resinae ATCC 22711]|uniref:Uncharacterized protein n=1 Tax=Amorphotheca resinae ATCC 22711 TaxID=857342 RepID=A0A2T3BAH5_AMORE|nr:hypothetical protein M430DRAFT_200888 [Amorphotheca resinae ATCC 22711]PSS25332.1 hypothetical protein M430DRAFT_200888 [Amorphotheca resinae ATCC 22711]
MDGSVTLADENLDPPPRLFERLRQIAGYTWDESQDPYHSSYSNWQVYGHKNTAAKHSSSGSNSGAVHSKYPFERRNSSHQEGSIKNEETSFVAISQALSAADSPPSKSLRTSMRSYRRPLAEWYLSLIVLAVIFWMILLITIGTSILIVDTDGSRRPKTP